MGKTLIVLRESNYSLNPPCGRLLFRYQEEIQVRELPLVASKEVDEKIPYELLNPLQSLFYYKYKGGNALVCAPTSAGKSLIAYLFMKNREGKKVYTAPTRSLVYEKALELKRYYPGLVEIRTGESILENYKKVKGDVIVSTYEHLVYALRNRSDWVQDVSCVIFDEIHQITKRWILEEAITYTLDRDITLLGLSATLPSYEDIARWIKADFVIHSEWRPVPLLREIRPLTEFSPIRKYENRDYQISARLLNSIFELSGNNEKVLIFVPQKKLGWKMLEVAKDEKIGIMNRTTPFEAHPDREPEIAFHNADVPKEEREEIEKAFREGRLKKLIATQTLAYGLNLPADRVVILVRIFPERGTWRCIPDLLDVLQMEGRAGRLGIKNVGYSHILTYGGKVEKLKDQIERTMELSIDMHISQRMNTDVLSLFILLGFLYQGKHYEKFLNKTYSYRNIKKIQLRHIVDFLHERGYLQGEKLTQKALYCVKSGIPPTKFEEFLRRLSLGLDPLVIVRPLLHMKRFDTLYDFVKSGESFEEDTHYIISKLSLCGHKCFQDNTDQFIFYTEGLTLKYPNVSSPPGEFSYLSTDALHLLRMLTELKKLGTWELSDKEMIAIAHAVKYGLTIEYAPLSGIKGIGHLRANLLKRIMQEEYILPPSVGSKVESLLEILKNMDLVSKMEHTLHIVRKLSLSRAKEETKKVLTLLENNREGFLVDDKILLAFGLFKLGERAFKMKKKELVRELLWNLPDRSSP
ncbi:DEAD/DEAH box helicase [Hydrogenobacter thermophilus]|uniref:DEAD/DEAH box helicase n=1 Tax=Hydrogenobacter thermophilus TaxID=940 RepID=UPI0030F82766